VKYAAFTGKAALVMRNKGCDNASTIHSLIYRARETATETPSFELWDDAPASKAKLIVIDECSMVDAELGRDLMSFGCPLLVLGDPAQAAADPGRRILHQCRAGRDADGSASAGAGRSDRPPVDGCARGTRVSRSATMATRRLSPPGARSGAGDGGRSGAGRAQQHPPRLQHARPREAGHRPIPLPVAGDKLVCLRNNRKKALFNGGLWRVKARAQSKSRIVTMRLVPDDETGARAVKVSVRADCSAGSMEDIPWEQRRPYDEFDFGYVLTVHKSQGSQWDDVVLFDESFAFQEARARWLYTGITRAAKRLSIVV
jgi:exodeoxyribonuclease-5